MTSEQVQRNKTGIVITSVCLGGVLIAGALIGSDSAARALTPPGQATLQSIPGAKVEFAGREAHISGVQPEQKDDAIRLVEGVNGVRWATVDTVGEASGAPTASAAPTDGEKSPATLALKRDGDTLVLTGEVPSQEAADSILEAAKQQFDGEVTSELKVNPGTTNAAWIEHAPDLFAGLNGISGLDFTLDGDGARVRGTVADPDARVAKITSALGDIPVASELSDPSAPFGDADRKQLESLAVLFEPDSTAISSSGAQILDQVASVLTKHPDVHLELVGHSAVATTTDAAEIAFSQSRAQSAADYLVGHGIDPSRLTVSGDGVANPLDDLTTPEGQANNRSVSFNVLKGNR